MWLDAAGRPEGFQICYVGRLREEHALTWRRQYVYGLTSQQVGDHNNNYYQKGRLTSVKTNSGRR